MRLLTVFGVLILVYSAFEGAKTFNRRAALDLSMTEGYIELIRYVRTQIDCYALPQDEILKRCDEDLLFRCGWLGGERPKELSELFLCATFSDKAAKKIALDFCSNLGRSYREEELKRCDESIYMLEQRRERLRNDAQNGKKLNFTLWLSGAAALIILLL